MKHIIFAYNYNTLCRTIRYIDSEWGVNNSIIIYAALDSKIPEAIINEYNTIVIPGPINSNYNGIAGNLISIYYAKMLWKIIRRIVKSSKEKLTIIIFRDNEPQEATMIDKLCGKYNEKFFLWLLEEGIGIYSANRVQIKAKKIKTIIYRLFGISMYAVSNNPQGKHPRLDRVICFTPEAYMKKIGNSNLEICKMQDIYTDSFNEHFVSLCLGNKVKRVSYDFVFLTVPIMDFPKSRYQGTVDDYLQNVKSILEIATKYGHVLIKLHPRDKLNYTEFESSKVHVCLIEENMIPYECLASWYGYPQMISAYSSASINSKGDKKSIYISDVLQIIDGGSGLDDSFYIDNNIIRCKSLKELENTLIKQKDGTL